MSKRRYNSKEFKNVAWEKLPERIQDSRVVFAVDVAKEDFVAMLMDEHLQTLERFKWRHPQNTAQVIERIQVLGQQRSVEAVMEPTGTYGDVLAWWLRKAGIALFRAAPKRVHDAAEVYDGVPSLHDAKAAYLIGRLHLDGGTQPWLAPSDRRRTLQALTTRLELCKARYQAGLNRLEAQLSRYWPESLQILALNTVSLHELIAHYGDPGAVRDDRAGAQALLQRIGRTLLKEEKITALLNSAEHTIGVPCLEPERALLQWLAGDIRQTYQQLRAAERDIAAQVACSAEVEAIGAVVGKTTAAVLSAAMDSPQNYPNSERYLKAMGLNLKEHSSGKHKGQLKITKRGPAVARFYLYFAALRLIAHNPVVADWYQHKTRRPGAIKNKTVIELMRKLAKALWHVARGERFVPEQLFNQHLPV